MHPAGRQRADTGSEHPGIAQMDVGSAVLPSEQATVALGQTPHHILRSTVLLATPHQLTGLLDLGSWQQKIPGLRGLSRVLVRDEPLHPPYRKRATDRENSSAAATS